MKRKKIKLLAGVMIIAMTGAVFVGCGNNSASNEGKVTITVSDQLQWTTNGKNSRKV